MTTCWGGGGPRCGLRLTDGLGIRGRGVRFERGADFSEPSIGVKAADVFVPGDGDGLEHGLSEVGERAGELRFDLALCGGAKEAGHGGAKIASGQQFCGKEAGYVLTDLFGG